MPIDAAKLGPSLAPLSAEETIAVLLAWFNHCFPTQESCLEELYTRCLADKVRSCPHCDSEVFQEACNARVVKCTFCRKKTWRTAGTFFHRMRNPRAWLAAIWFMEHGVILSSSRFHKTFGIAQSSALHIFKKITTVVQSHMDDLPEVPSAQFSLVFCKRSRLTPARKHPRSEEDEVQSHDVCDGSAAVLQSDLPPRTSHDVPELSAEEKSVYGQLSQVPMHFDIICRRTRLAANQVSAALTPLELAGLVIRRPGNQFVQYITTDNDSTSSHSVKDSSREAKVNLGPSIDVIRSQFHGISRKYLQNYLAAIFCRIAKERWQGGVLFKACFEFGCLTARHIREQVSPALVRVPVAS